ncbi:DUF4394 domain-containing protein [Lunatimonas lonarensis]|nr:DUF4394 domain-containing protein [Lunatimonas lonarensis]
MITFHFSKSMLPLALAVGIGLSSCNDDMMPPVENPDELMGTAPEVMFTALTNDNRLVNYQARNLNDPMDIRSISGLPSGEMIISIDYRPATGQLYALGSSSRLYLINENNGMATPLGEGAFSPAIMGENASIDFNPTVDRIRLVTASGQNLRLHPETGQVIATDGMIRGGDNPQIGAIAYTNSMAGASSTLLYDIDFRANTLYIQNPPNEGGLEEVGPLGMDLMGMGNFDITPDNNAALAVTLHEGESRLYSIALSSGQTQWVGRFTLPILGIAFKTNPIAYASSKDNKLYRFNPNAPTMNPVDLTGLMEGEWIAGLDFRPANGALFAITNKSRLLVVNTANGTVMEVGDGLSPTVEGYYLGFDFNPLVDRIRLISGSGQNLRLHPVLGTVVATDGNLNPGSPMATAAAYTNNFPGTASTLLYVIDSESNMLYTQDPPNDGVLQPVGQLGIDIEADNGFDIGGSSNMAFALLKVNNSTGVYGIDLSTGNATKIADFAIEATAMAVGLGF